MPDEIWAGPEDWGTEQYKYADRMTRYVRADRGADRDRARRTELADALAAALKEEEEYVGLPAAGADLVTIPYGAVRDAIAYLREGLTKGEGTGYHKEE